MISQKIAALLVLILFAFEAYGKTKKYSVEVFSRLKVSQSFVKSDEESLSGYETSPYSGSFSYSEVNWNYNISSQLMYQFGLSFITYSNLKLIPLPKIKDSFLLYKFDRNTNFQTGFFPAPLGYYYDNLRKFSFMETNFGTLNIKSLYIGGLNGSFYFDIVDFGVLLNKKINSRLSTQLAIGFPAYTLELFSDRDKSSSLSGVANLIYKANSYEAFATYSYRSGKVNSIASDVTYSYPNGAVNSIDSEDEENEPSFANKSNNFLGVGGKTRFRVKTNKKILVTVQGEAWLTSRGYARPIPEPEPSEENLSGLKDFGLCWTFWDCPQEISVAPVVPATPAPSSFNLNIVSAYVFPEVHWKRFKLGLLLGASSSSIDKENKSFKESLNYEYILQGSYKLTKELSFVLEHFYQDSSNYLHKNLSFKSYASDFKTNNTVIKGWAVSLNATFSK